MANRRKPSGKSFERPPARPLAHPAAAPAAGPAGRIGWLQALNPQFWSRPSVVVLIAANLLPLVGVASWGWDLFTLMFLYWMETGIIGVFAIIEMALAARWLALFLVPFFIVHFGGFMVGHLVFLTLMFGGRDVSRPEQLPEFAATVVHEHGLLLAIAALFVSHGVSFVLNVLRTYVWKREPVRRGGAAEPAEPAQPHATMLAPYGRVIVMHITIIIGALLSELFKTKTAALALLVALKIAVDVAAHVRKNFSGDGAVR